MAFVTEFEWAISNTETAYPFINPVFIPGFSTPFSHIVADAAVGVTGLSGDLRLSSLSSAESGAKAVITDGVDSIMFSNGEAADYGIWRVLSWAGARGSLRLTLLKDRIADVPWPLSPRDAVFSPNALLLEPREVTSITAGIARVDGAVTLRLGYSIDAATAAEGTAARPATGITVTAESGSGEGVAPCAETCPPMIRTINGVTPNPERDFTLEGTDCYVVLPRLMARTRTVDGEPVTEFSETEAVLDIFNNCSPCCDCDDYGIVYEEMMTPVMEKGHELADKYHELLTRYKDMMDKIRTLATCKSRPEVRLVATPSHNRSAHVAVGFFNNSETPWPSYPQVVHVDFASLDATPARVVDAEVFLHNKDGKNLTGAAVTDSYVEVILYPVPCCSTSWISFSLVWDGAGAPVPYTISSYGMLDDTPYGVSAAQSTLPPVNRNS